MSELKNMDRVKYVHFRRVRRGQKQLALTLALQDVQGETLIGMAAVSEEDNGSREKGRRLATGRLSALQAGKQFLPWAHRIPATRREEFIEALRTLEEQNLIFARGRSINVDLMQQFVTYQIPGSLPKVATVIA